MSDIGSKPPLLAFRRADRALCQDFTRNLQGWERKKPETMAERNRLKAREYIQAIGGELIRHSYQGFDNFGIMGRGSPFFAGHPGIVEQYNRAVDAMKGIWMRDITPWAQATGIDFRDSAVTKRLIGYFGEYIAEMAWDKSLYPDTLMKGKKTPQQWSAIAGKLVDQVIERIEADKGAIFSRMFPRKRPARLPPSLRNFTL